MTLATATAERCTHRPRGKALPDRLKQVHPAALLRSAAADRWLAKAYRTMRTVYRSWVQDVVARYADGLLNEVGSRDQAALEDRLYAAGRPLTYSMVEGGYDWTRQEFNSEGGRSGVPGLAAKETVPQVGVPEWQDFIGQADFTGVEDHIRAVSQRAAATQAGAVNRIFTAAGDTGATRQDVAKQLLADGLVQTDMRAALWARTETQWAYNEGAHQAYIAAGVSVEEWVTTQDDATCEFCGAMDGVKVRTNDNFVEAGDSVTGLDGGTYTTQFPAGHPPLHPNCRCVVVPADEAIGRT